MVIFQGNVAESASKRRGVSFRFWGSMILAFLAMYVVAFAACAKVADFRSFAGPRYYFYFSQSHIVNASLGVVFYPFVFLLEIVGGCFVTNSTDWGVMRRDDTPRLLMAIIDGAPALVIAAMAIVFGVMVAPALACAIRSARANQRHRKNLCCECGYDLRGLSEPRCPECGTVRPARQSGQRWSR